MDASDSVVAALLIGVSQALKADIVYSFLESRYTVGSCTVVQWIITTSSAVDHAVYHCNEFGYFPLKDINVSIEELV